MTTRIFKVEYWFSETYNGKNGQAFKETRSVTAKDAMEAISKTSTLIQKPSSFIDDDKKKVKVIRKDFDPINVTLEAEAE